MKRLLLAVFPLLVTLGVVLAGALAMDAVSPEPVSAVPVIGVNSCQGAGACDGLGDDAVIGNNSCNGLSACQDFTGTVGNGSCQNSSACSGFGGTIGDNSCQFTSACQGGDGDIGDGSCNQVSTCTNLTGEIGLGSCNALSACQGVTGTIGNFACNGTSTCSGVSGTVEDCQNNEPLHDACYVEVTKSANPTSIPETGDTDVTYTVRIDLIEDQVIHSIEDDQFPGLDPATDCELFDDNGVSQGAVVQSGDFISGHFIICEYTYQPPPGVGGTTHDNTVTLNVGEFEISLLAVEPADGPGPYDVSDTASVLYIEVEDPDDDDDDDDPDKPHHPNRPPNIAGALGGLFQGGPPQPYAPTPVPSPVFVPTDQVISPPNTGDGGMRAGGNVEWAVAAVLVTVVFVPAVVVVERVRRR